MESGINKNKLDKLFEDSLENAELQPPENVWHALETKLLNEQSERDRKKIIYLRWLVAACIALMVSFGLFYKSNQTSKTNTSLEITNNFTQSTSKKKKDVVDSETLTKKRILQTKVNNTSKDNTITVDELKKQEQNNETETNKSLTANKQNNNILATKTMADLSTKPAQKDAITDELVKHKTINKQENKTSLTKEKTKIVDELINSELASTINNSEIVKKTATNKTNNLIDDKLEGLSQVKNENTLIKTDEVSHNLTKNKNTDSNQKNSDYQKKIFEKNPVPRNLEETILIKKEILLPGYPVSIALLADSAMPLIVINTPKSTSIQGMNKNHMWLEAMYSPDYSYQRFVIAPSAKSNENTKSLKKNYEQYSQPKYGFTTGIQFGYGLSEKFTIQTGIVYAENGEKTNNALLIDTTVASVTALSGTNNFINTTNKVVSIYNTSISYSNTQAANFTINRNQTVNYKYEYFTIPLLISYRIIDKGILSFYSSIGASANFFYQYRISVKNKSSQNEIVLNADSSPFRKVYYSAILSVGAEYKFNNKLSLHIAPTVRYGITSAAKNSTPVNGFLYSAGLASSLRYCF